MFKYVAIIIIVIVITPFAINNSGYCVSKSRFISDEEKIKNVLFWAFTKSRAGVQYDSRGIAEKYLKENPDCCRMGPVSQEGDLYPYVQLTMLRRYLGLAVDVVVITIENKKQQLTVDSCGIVKTIGD